MKWNTEIKQITAEAEKAVRALIQDAAAVGEYEAVTRMVQIAENFAEIGNRFDSVRRESPERTERAGENSIASRAQKRRKGKKGDYPRFHRAGDDLVKTAWSKSSKREYQHKASRRTLMRVVEAISEGLAEDGHFVMDDILPVKQTAGGKDVPSYQSYLCLAWLIDRGLIQKDGRSGYFVPKRQSLSDEVNGQWALLTQG